MTIDKIIHKFPAIFKNFNFNDIDIENMPLINECYRACINGLLNKDAFLPSYIEFGFKDAEVKKREELSISLFRKLKQAKRIAMFLQKKKSKPYNIAMGKTNRAFGIWDLNDKDGHINYWLFENIDPSVDFEKVGEW